MTWEVIDSYGVVVHTARTLTDCGIWIDPVLGIQFRREYSNRAERDLPEVERFWAKVIRSDVDDGCWEHPGAPNKKGYAQVRVNTKSWLAHRYAWTITNGPIPDGLYVLHRCDNPPCVRPDHLFLGTKADNNADMTAKGRHGWAKRTHCVNGHEWTPENTRIGKKNQRECRACDRERGSHAKRWKRRPARQTQVNIDADRFTRNPDGTYTVQMYEGGGGIGGTLTVRKRK